MLGPLYNHVTCLIHRKVLILLEVTVLRKGEDTQRFGEPVQYDEKTDKSSPPKPNNKPAVQQSSG